jgi:hypothetical protein
MDDKNSQPSKLKIAGAVLVSVAVESGRVMKAVGFKSKWAMLILAVASSVGVVLNQDDASLPVMPNSSVQWTEPAE